MEDDKRFRHRLQELAEGERERLGSAPTPEEVLALVEGRLAGDELERVSDGVAAFPESARLTLALRRFPEVDPDAEADGALEAEIAASWRRVQETLPSPVVSPPARDDKPAGRGAPARWGWSLAAGLMGLALGFSVARWGEPPAPEVVEPRPNPAVRTLVPSSFTPRGAEPEPVELEASAGDLVLILPFVEPTEGDRHRLSLQDAAGEEVWSTENLLRRPDGTFTLTLPREYLPSGRYTLVVYPAGAAPGDPIERYDLDLRLP